ncbi:MAG: nuclease domain-containing protein [Marivita sp.]
MNLMGKEPLGLKPEKAPKEAKPRQMRRVAKGKKSSSDCPIMKSAKGESCLADWCGCGGSTETTAMRHVRKFNVAGMGQKPPNYIAFYGCQKAEDLFALKGEQEWTWEGLMRAVVLTQMKLRAKGLLPL